MINLFEYSGKLSTNMASWVHDQMYNVSATSHREFFRKRVDGSPYGFLEGNDYYEEGQMLKVRNPCDEGSRWTEYSFTNDDYGEEVQVTPRRQQGDYIISVDGVPRTIVSKWEDEDGNQLRTGYLWYFCKYPSR